MANDFNIAALIGTAYVWGLTLTAIIMVIRGNKQRAEVSGGAFPKLVGQMKGKIFSPAMRANPNRVN